MRFDALLATTPVFNVFKTYSSKHKLFLRTVVLCEDAPDVEWGRDIVAEQAELLAGLRHHNVCPLFEYGEVDGAFTASTPLLDGYPLSSYDPGKHGLLNVNKIVEVMQAAALGLAVAHYKDIVHHDICPENVHVDARGTVRVKEFLVSRFVYFFDQRREKSPDGRIRISVSPYFVSPERAESGLEDHRGDVFSFGVMFYYLLTGVYPFDCETNTRTIRARIKPAVRKKKEEKKRVEEIFHAGGIPTTVATDDDPVHEYLPPVPPRERRVGVPKALSDVVLSMLSYYPNDRPTFSELIHCLNLLRAKTDVLKIRKTQEEIVDSETKDIPRMEALSKFKKNLEDA
jgi:serine/threonine protein kinase